MNMEDMLQETLAEILKNLRIPFRKFKVQMREHVPTSETAYRIDIDSDEAATLIGYHGETIYALHHILKTLIWKKTDARVFVVLDVDGYRKRQEESVVAMALRKVEEARTTFRDQPLPPMSPYFRRVVHTALAKSEFGDIVTESIGAGENRAVTIKIRQQNAAS